MRIKLLVHIPKGLVLVANLALESTKQDVRIIQEEVLHLCTTNNEI